MDFNEFISELSNMTAPEILELVGSWILRVVFGLFAIIAARYGYKIYKKENVDMSEKTVKRGKPTEFTQYKTEYALTDDGELKATGKKIDVQAQIQSQRSKCMDRILDKFLEQEIGLPQSEAVYGDGTHLMDDPKEAYANALAYAEALRLKYNIPVEDDGQYIEPQKVLEDLSSDNDEIKEILQPKTKTAEQLEYEAFLKWKEAQNNEKEKIE